MRATGMEKTEAVETGASNFYAEKPYAPCVMTSPFGFCYQNLTRRGPRRSLQGARRRRATRLSSTSAGPPASLSHFVLLTLCYLEEYAEFGRVQFVREDLPDYYLRRSRECR